MSENIPAPKLTEQCSMCNNKSDVYIQCVNKLNGATIGYACRDCAYKILPIKSCALCRKTISLFVGCVCRKCYEDDVLPLKKTKLSKPIPVQDPDADW